MNTLFIICLSLFIASYLLTGVFRICALKWGLLDVPNQRSSHSEPTPKGAGIVFSLLWLLFVITLYAFHFLTLHYVLLLVPTVLVISIMGYCDDHFDVPARFRLFMQVIVAAATLWVLQGFPSLNIGFASIHWTWFGLMTAGFSIVWSINLYNFMDGADGLAGFQALFIFGVGGYFMRMAGAYSMAALAWGLTAVVAGFLLWNYPPAKVFMGDVGSTFLGLLVAIFALMGESEYHIPSLLWLMLYGPFVFDATITVIRRIIAGEKWYMAHHLHAFQRLYKRGWSHHQILLGFTVINSIIAMITLWAFRHQTYLLAAMAGELVFLSVVYAMIERLQPMYTLRD